MKLHKLGMFREDSICSSHFRDNQKFEWVMPEVIILDLFLAIFPGLITHTKSNLYKIFTSDAMEGNVSQIFWCSLKITRN